MQVRHHFARVRTGVDDQAVAGLLQSELLGDRRGLEQQVSEHLVVVGCGQGEARDAFLGDDQHMRGRLWVDVPERAHQLVFVNDVRGNLAGDDLFKNRFAHGADRLGGTGLFHNQAALLFV